VIEKIWKIQKKGTLEKIKRKKKRNTHIKKVEGTDVPPLKI